MRATDIDLRRVRMSDFSGGVGLNAMDELVFCLPEKKWMSIYVHLVLPEACLLPGYPPS
jgi:hypothetical protein